VPKRSQSSNHIERRELRPLGVGVAKPARDHAQDHERDARMPIEESQKVRAWDDQRIHRFDRRNRRRARAVFDGCELADQFTWSDDAEDGLPARLDDGDLGAPAEQHHDLPGLIRLVEDRDVRAVGPSDTRGPKRVRLLAGQGL
jgi:hypothetical protein